MMTRQYSFWGKGQQLIEWFQFPRFGVKEPNHHHKNCLYSLWNKCLVSLIRTKFFYLQLEPSMLRNLSLCKLRDFKGFPILWIFPSYLFWKYVQLPPGQTDMNVITQAQKDDHKVGKLQRKIRGSTQGWNCEQEREIEIRSHYNKFST